MTMGVDLATAIETYARLLERRRVPKREQTRRLTFIRQFSRHMYGHTPVAAIGTRDVVEFFAEHADDYIDPNGWLERYRILDGFFDDLTDLGLVASNRIKGIYDDSDPEPDLLENGLPDDDPVPVDWAVRELPLGFRRT
jgi:hypothetical protein